MGRKIKSGDYKPAVAISREAKDRIADWCKQNDEDMGRTISRVLLWFVESDPLVQAVVVSKPIQQLDQLRAEALRRMADQVERGDPRTIEEISDSNDVKQRPEHGAHSKPARGRGESEEQPVARAS
jgi:hypothetical protein